MRYEYANGLTMFAMATQQRGISTRVGNVIHGTKGTAHVDRGTATIKGEKPWEFDGQGSSGDLEMHAALIRSIREGKPINEGVRLAEATMTGVMGRMSAYTGRALKWDWAMNASKLDLRPAEVRDGSAAGRAGGDAGAHAARLIAGRRNGPDVEDGLGPAGLSRVAPGRYLPGFRSVAPDRNGLP